ncbi:2TM domain-containing protein [Maribacter sp.]|uniref:2TM domain-containing protein n=1 Tax=Maribacter sp. TaxID=1897614 RepID=UPI0025BE6943|nr:2TM domain-containing protein [Maribacter sp.]
MNNQKLQLAKKKVKAIKHWYILIIFAVVGTIFMIWFNSYLRSIGTPVFGSLAVMIGPVIWWVIVLFKGLSIHNKFPKFFKSWEEKQIQKFMEEDKRRSEKFR